MPSSNAAPPEQTSKAISLQVSLPSHKAWRTVRGVTRDSQTAVVVDNPPIFKHFGDVLVDVQSDVYHAGDTVAVRFVGANPRVSLPTPSQIDSVYFRPDPAINTTRTI
jgi:neutral ceramidase